MELIYTERTSNFEKDKSYRNPQYFDKPEKATKVIIEGDYPNIVEAYEAVGIKVSTGAEKESGPINPSDMKVDQLKEILTAKGIEFPDNAKKADLVKLLEEAGGA
ncbi:hypothetical protein DM558_07605 [Entomomonas moraniae]|uniref:HeH/LEM domain-containing protein n=2 Tax=Entomomonas moraniae TaxID=2213226 RepID=A0A3Q9JIM2_9GAMM|nr:hypothetical protein DM558_06250 [Entomomonas moraniae]AZS52198.1 hypothetical protein DM558_07605 [Entomomonas moraniae]